ncbi:MAG: murein biosynthesis integral membrane protein MurJ [Peptococcaceae bacterium]|jgi:putative peptidoglycan lipid II flippase|nr:murein biosynthesis integral membrane protein MurJ [Peptococcaceae bacterium]
MPGMQNLAKAAGFLMLVNLGSRLLGFLRETLIAGYFGQQSATDAYNIAFVLPDLLYWLLMGGVLSSALIPVFSEYIAKGQEEEGWRVVSSTMNIILLALSFCTLLGLILAPQFMALEAPGLSEDYQSLAVLLTRIILIQPLILAFSGFAMGILNSYKIFWPSALGTLLYNAGIILVGPLLVSGWHMGIEGFAFGVVFGAVANIAVQIPALRRLGMRYYPVIDWRHPGVRRILVLAIPIILGYAINQIPVAIYSNLASLLPPGSVSAVNRAYRLFQMPIGIFALAIGVAVFPTLTEQVALKRLRELKATISLAVRMVIYITLPVSVGMIILRYPLIRLLFEHGAFTAQNTADTTVPLIFFCLGITAQSVTNILPRVFYAFNDTWTPVILGILSMIVNVLAMILFVKPLAGGGLALATSLAGAVNMLLLFAVMRRRMRRIGGGQILKTTGQTLIASLCMGVAVWLSQYGVARMLGTEGVASLASLVLGAGVGALVFAGLSKMMRMEEFAQTMGLVLRRLGKNG